MKRLIFLIFLGFPDLIFGQIVDSTAFVNLTDAILRLQTSEAMQHGVLGVSLSATGNEEQLLSLNADKALPPASTMKLATTAAALEILGENFTFDTFLEYDGSLINGVLKGNLYIRGMGDPSLGSPRFKDQTDSATVFNAWLAAIQKAGIQRIDGKIVADASAMDDMGIEDSWHWSDVLTGYGVATTGLNWNENICRMYFKTGTKTGDPATLLRIVPDENKFRIVNRVTTGPVGSGNKVNIRPASNLAYLILDGTIPKTKNEYSVRVALTDPPLLLARHFTDFLVSQNIPVKGAPEVWQPVSQSPQRNLILTWKSPTLTELCKQINWWSLNLYADAIYKTVGKKLIGKTDYAEIAPALTAFWALKGVNTSGVVLRDGSGLAGTALLTPQNLTGILNAAARFKSFPVFLESIPIAGAAGTVRNRRFGNKSTVRAKSGSIEATRAYAGYVQTKSGNRLSFAVNAHRYHPESTNEITQGLMEIVRLIGEL